MSFGGIRWAREAVYRGRRSRECSFILRIRSAVPHLCVARWNLDKGLVCCSRQHTCSLDGFLARLGHDTTRSLPRIAAPATHSCSRSRCAVVKRKAVAPSAGSPPYFQTNVSIPVLPAGRQRLYFLPDRVLVLDAHGVGSIGFEQLQVSSRDQRFVEDGGVPSDTRVVDTTWRYVNKKGGPDKRFKNNREIPIVIYEEILLASRSGLQELFQASRTGVGSVLNSAVKQMAKAISQRGDPQTEEGFIKCPCNNCDVFIEFPAHGVGQAIACPHCTLETILFKPDVQV